MKIAIYAFDGVPMFHLAVPQMVFEEVKRQGHGWSTELFSDGVESLRTAEGYQLGGISGPEAAIGADVVVVPSWFDDDRAAGGDLQALLVEAHRSGATIMGLCLGALAVADTGLLDHRSAVTHWKSVDDLAGRRPAVHIDASVLYIDHGDVITSAGTASGIDACLHLVRKNLGAAATNAVSRALVVAPHREGGQAQYIERPIRPPQTDDPISRVIEWALNNLLEPLSIEQLASRAHMSRRTFIRDFQASTGTTPASWVRSRRLDESRRLLEETTLPIDQVASASGFTSTVTMRQNFATAFATTPTDYRRRFEALLPSE
ncbi:helix-turn-helix domain-containing protein [Pseudarthrobacter sp. MEB009]|uniref:GlxA family transcriptional regulator n=1 Tax=Pseudarthrobacter sp. MEB009 TaxID=3040326 RepID=UPI002552B6F9|nr:helix-turn-helix domain-containing protein [Pseudarthrobacter sp. MEB009]